MSKLELLELGDLKNIIKVGNKCAMTANLFDLKKEISELGAIVETVTTNANGKLSNLTYEIPDFLQNASQVAIRLESPHTGYYAYNWFYNNSTSMFINHISQPPGIIVKNRYAGRDVIKKFIRGGSIVKGGYIC